MSERAIKVNMLGDLKFTLSLVSAEPCWNRGEVRPITERTPWRCVLPEEIKRNYEDIHGVLVPLSRIVYLRLFKTVTKLKTFMFHTAIEVVGFEYATKTTLVYQFNTTRDVVVSVIRDVAKHCAPDRVYLGDKITVSTTCGYFEYDLQGTRLKAPGLLGFSISK